MAAGLDYDAVWREVDEERLHPLFFNTWAVGHKAVTKEGWFLAATRSIGGDAKLTGPSTLQLRGVLKGRVGKIHVVTTKRPADRPRIRIHSVQEVPPGRPYRGIPTVTVEEALIVTAATNIDDKRLRRAVRQAFVDKHVTVESMKRAVEDAKGRPGIGRLRTILNTQHSRSKSELEDAAIALLRRYGYDPESNAEILGEEMDLVVDGVIIELDSEEFHDNPVQADDDARRQDAAVAAGIPVQRWTWDDVTARPVRTIRRLAAAVA